MLVLIQQSKESNLRLIKKNDRVADFGGGRGDRWVSILKKYPNLSLTFYEPDEDELNKAKKILSGKNVYFFSSTEQISTQSCDFIFSFAVLEHVWNQKLFFSEISRILKKDGCAIVSYDDGHFRNYLYRDRSYAFQFRNYLKTKLHKLWQFLNIYRKYQYPVNPDNLNQILKMNNLKIIDEFYSRIDNFKNFKIHVDAPPNQKIQTTIYNLERILNSEYKKYHPSNERFGKHGSLWKLMGTRTIKIRHNK